MIFEDTFEYTTNIVIKLIYFFTLPYVRQDYNYLKIVIM